MEDDANIIGKLIKNAVKSLEEDGVNNGPKDLEELGISFVNSKGDTYLTNIRKLHNFFICDVTVIRKSGKIKTLYQEKIQR